jgi:hypothetical protein
MNKETLIFCKHEIDKLMREYLATNGKSQTIQEIAKRNTDAIYLLAAIVKLMLQDKQ